jgi:hypothetical protein
VAGPAGWAGREGGKGRLGQKWGRRGKREERGFFLFLKNLFSLDECIYILNNQKGMHGSAWCITQNKVF